MTNKGGSRAFETAAARRDADLVIETEHEISSRLGTVRRQ